MSLMKTLAKVAIGVAVAKGAKSMMQRGSGNTQQAGGGLGGLLGGLTGGAQQQPSGGGLEDMLGGLLGGQGAGGAAGGLGGMLQQLGGAQGSSGGGLAGMLGGLTGGQGGAGDGLGGLLGGLAGAAGAGGMLGGLADKMQQRPQSNNKGFGEVFNSQFDQTPEPVIEPTQEQEATAGLMLAALIQAAKSDGKFDEGERQKLMEKLGDVDREEAAFVQEQMQAPVDIDGLVSGTPKGMEQQVYAISLLGIDLDTQEEAQYLHKLAQGYGLQPAQVNAIHEQLGAPSLYT